MSALRKQIFGGFSGAALALGTAFGAAMPASAQDNNPTNVALQQVSSITEAEALERSTGKVLLHYGEGITPLDIATNLRALEIIGIVAEAHAGSQNNNRIEIFFYGNKLPIAFEGNDGGELVYLVEALAKKHGLIANNNVPTADAG